MTYYQKLEWNLDSILKEQSLTLKQAAEKTNLHLNVIERIKNQKQTRSDLETIEKILIGLKIDPNQLFRFVNKEE
ncbi:helix-turn-helix transcriptional regulator [Bacillus cereus]|nr:helix-turn-helix transcriptional regulator [Bacillus cereus]MEC3260897.1 helix-turn-helix transcriptional regulator [Bacillus cereus]